MDADPSVSRRAAHDSVADTQEYEATQLEAAPVATGEAVPGCRARAVQHAGIAHGAATPDRKRARQFAPARCSGDQPCATRAEVGAERSRSPDAPSSRSREATDSGDDGQPTLVRRLRELAMRPDFSDLVAATARAILAVEREVVSGGSELS